MLKYVSLCQYGPFLSCSSIKSTLQKAFNLSDLRPLRSRVCLCSSVKHYSWLLFHTLVAIFRRPRPWYLLEDRDSTRALLIDCVDQADNCGLARSFRRHTTRILSKHCPTPQRVISIVWCLAHVWASMNVWATTALNALLWDRACLIDWAANRVYSISTTISQVLGAIHIVILAWALTFALHCHREFFAVSLVWALYFIGTFLFHFVTYYQRSLVRTSLLVF